MIRVLAFALVAAGAAVADPDPSCKISIGVDLPLTGRPASFALPVLDGVRFAVADRWKGRVAGCALELEVFDDSASGRPSPAKGVRNVQAMIADPDLLGFVGPFNSFVARAEIPVANPAQLAMVSPSNTNPCLTHGPPFWPASCTELAPSLRPSGVNNYFRVITTDDLQGAAMADFAIDGLGVHSVAVVTDAPGFGRFNANAFAARLAARGGTVAVRQDLVLAPEVAPTPEERIAFFNSFLSAAVDAGAEAIYYGGWNCALRSRMNALMPAAPLLGTDSLLSVDGGACGPGIFSVTPGVDATHRPEAQGVLEAYSDVYPNPADYDFYTMAGYDAANTLVLAIARAMDDSGSVPTRAAVVAQLASGDDFPGVWGEHAFDRNGDTTNRVLTVFAGTAGGGALWVGEISLAPSPNVPGGEDGEESETDDDEAR